MNSYMALPEDRYVYGFDKMDLRMVMSPEAQVKLLVEKLVIFDGQFKGYEGKFFNGLPYTGLYNGTPSIVTKFLNIPGTAEQMDFIITPAGRFAPLMFDIGMLGAAAEKVPFSANSIGLYG